MKVILLKDIKGTGKKDGGKKRSHQFSGIVFHGISFGDFYSNIFYIIQEQKFFVNKKEPAIFSRLSPEK
jgi:hypothetical protein